MLVADAPPGEEAQVDFGLMGAMYDPETQRTRRRTVRIYIRTELIKTHPRVAPGKRSTDPNDYPQERRGYAMRSVDGLLARAKDRGEHIGAFAQRLLGGPLPWTTMRQGYELLRLCDRHGEARVDALCKRALDFDVIDVPRLGRMLKLAIAVEERACEDGKLRALPNSAPRFARSSETFATRHEDAHPLSGAQGRAQEAQARPDHSDAARPQLMLDETTEACSASVVATSPVP